MAVKNRTFVSMSLALLVWGLLASLTAGYYYYLYNDLFNKTQRTIVHVNIGINYGNGTPTRWFNGTRVRAGDTLLNATMLVVKMKYKVWPGLGAFVDSIDNVSNSGSFYWLWWVYTAYGWSQGQVASDRYVVDDNETYYWYYEDTSKWPPPSPP